MHEVKRARSRETQEEEVVRSRKIRDQQKLHHRSIFQGIILKFKKRLKFVKLCEHLASNLYLNYSRFRKFAMFRDI